MNTSASFSHLFDKKTEFGGWIRTLHYLRHFYESRNIIVNFWRKFFWQFQSAVSLFVSSERQNRLSPVGAVRGLIITKLMGVHNGALRNVVLYLITKLQVVKVDYDQSQSRKLCSANGFQVMRRKRCIYSAKYSNFLKAKLDE